MVIPFRLLFMYTWPSSSKRKLNGWSLNAMHLFPQKVETGVPKIPTTQRHREEISCFGLIIILACNTFGNFVSYIGIVDVEPPRHDSWSSRSTSLHSESEADHDHDYKLRIYINPNFQVKLSYVLFLALGLKVGKCLKTRYSTLFS